MRILIDMGHPGHVHYFRNAIGQLILNNHEVLIVARDKEFVIELLNIYSLPHLVRGKGSNSLLGKFLYMIKADIQILKASLKFKPDLFLSFSSAYAAQVAYVLRKPHIAITDTEHEDNINSIFTFPFSSYILTPSCYLNDLGNKHIRFDNVIEGFYLHKEYFKPSQNIKAELMLKEHEEYVILRFVSWKAHHDFGQSGLDIFTKRKLIELLIPKYKVFISSEGELPDEFKPYKIIISPEKMHDVLAFASIFIGESATMASESVILGTKSVYINSLPLMGYLKIEQDAGLLKYFNSSVGVADYISDLLDSSNLKSTSIEKSKKMQKKFINSTKFLVWFVENYPESAKIMKENQDYQYRFN